MTKPDILKLISTVLITGALQMDLVKLFCAHHELWFMIFDHWWQYIVEALFYSCMHGLIVMWIYRRKNKKQSLRCQQLCKGEKECQLSK